MKEDEKGVEDGWLNAANADWMRELMAFTYGKVLARKMDEGALEDEEFVECLNGIAGKTLTKDEWRAAIERAKKTRFAYVVDPSDIVVEDLMVEDPKPHSIVRMK